MRVVSLLALCAALGALSGCKEEERPPFNPRVLGGSDAGGFDPPMGISTGSGSGSSVPTVSAAGCIQNFSDNFFEGIRDSVWERGDNCGSRVVAADEAARIEAGPASASCSSSQGFLTLRNGRLCGDFDVSVDYRLIDWNNSEEGERWATLWARHNGGIAGIALDRIGGFEDGADCRDDASVYIAWTNNRSACTAAGRDALQLTSSTSGRLRISRENGTLSASLGGGSGWSSLLEVAGTTEPLELFVLAGTRGVQQIVQFDNITVRTEGH